MEMYFESEPIKNQHLFLDLINNQDFSKRYSIVLNHTQSYEDLCKIIKNEMQIHKNYKIRLFKKSGVEVMEEDIKYLKQKEELYVSKGEDFNLIQALEEYEIIDKLGEGGFGNVVLAINKKTKQQVALKFIKNESTKYLCKNIDMIFDEANALKALNHQNIVKIIDFFPLENMEAAFVMEYLKGGELKQYLKKQGGKLSEQEAQFMFKQMVNAIYYCHQQHNIIHRDLKLENILLTDENTRNIKIVDFGISGIYSAQNNDPTNKGSLRYIAPEVFEYNKPAHPSIDVWSLGVILYTILFGKYPFDSPDKKQIPELVMKGKFQITAEMKGQVTEAAIDLVEKMLIKDPSERINIIDISNHHWLNQEIYQIKIEEQQLAKQRLEQERLKGNQIKPIIKKNSVTTQSNSPLIKKLKSISQQSTKQASSIDSQSQINKAQSPGRITNRSILKTMGNSNNKQNNIYRHASNSPQKVTAENKLLINQKQNAQPWKSYKELKPENKKQSIIQPIEVENQQEK